MSVIAFLLTFKGRLTSRNFRIQQPHDVFLIEPRLSFAFAFCSSDWLTAFISRLSN